MSPNILLNATAVPGLELCHRVLELGAHVLEICIVHLQNLLLHNAAAAIVVCAKRASKNKSEWSGVECCVCYCLIVSVSVAVGSKGENGK